MILNERIIFNKEHNELINDKIEDFTHKLSSRDQSKQYYINNRNASSEKVTHDIMVGKKGEFIASYWLYKRKGYPITKPDLKIYQNKKKNWRADLFYDGYNDVNVKTCNLETIKYVNQLSWTFQYGNKFGSGGMDALLKKPKNQDIILVYLDNYASREGVIKYFGPMSNIINLLKDPISRKLYGIKKCLYMSDLENFYTITI